MRAVWFVLVAGLVFLGVMALANQTAAPTAAPSVTVSGATVGARGNGTLNTRPFRLAAGNYRVMWRASAPSVIVCSPDLTLRPVSGTAWRPITVGVMVNPGTPASGETVLYDVASSDYYVVAITTCGWEVSLQPQ